MAVPRSSLNGAGHAAEFPRNKVGVQADGNRAIEEPLGRWPGGYLSRHCPFGDQIVSSPPWTHRNLL